MSEFVFPARNKTLILSPEMDSKIRLHIPRPFQGQSRIPEQGSKYKIKSTQSERWLHIFLLSSLAWGSFLLIYLFYLFIYLFIYCLFIYSFIYLFATFNINWSGENKKCSKEIIDEIIYENKQGWLNSIGIYFFQYFGRHGLPSSL